ncbi:MAG: PD-(D/E)XK nuclease family protein [Atopobiaceae bacterium]|jgi:ATP-dependent helicase/nuclease subunit B
MPLQIILGEDTCLARALREQLATKESTAQEITVLVPTFDQVNDIKRSFANSAELSLGLRLTTVSAWVRERWSVFGDGRKIISHDERYVLVKQTMRAGCSEGSEDTSPQSEGEIGALAHLSQRILPYIDVADSDAQSTEIHAQAGALSAGERRVLAALKDVRSEIHAHRFIEPSEVEFCLAERMRAANAQVGSVIFLGLPHASATLQHMVCELAHYTDVVCYFPVGTTYAGDVFAHLAESLHTKACEQGVEVFLRHAQGQGEDEAAGELQDLSRALYAKNVRPEPVYATGAVRLLEAQGPAAEAELMAQEMAKMYEAGVRDVVVVCPDVYKTWRSLAPKLAARGAHVGATYAKPLTEVPAVRDFLGFASCVASLMELQETWPKPHKVGADMVPELGDMSWWPPRVLTDFLLNDASGASKDAAWRLDLKWRGNRSLTPDDVLTHLKRQSLTSAAVAHATISLMQGRLSSAALDIKRGLDAPAPAVAPSDAPADVPTQEVSAATQEAAAGLAAIAELAAKVARLGFSTNEQTKAQHISLSELIDLVAQMAAQGSIMCQEELVGDKTPAADTYALEGLAVRIASRQEAASMDARSHEAVVACGLTSHEWPLAPRDDCSTALVEKLTGTAEEDPLADARREMSALVRVPRRFLALERVLMDENSKVTYPAVVLSECLACYAHASERPEDMVSLRLAEGRPQDLLSNTYREQALEAQETPHEAGVLSEHLQDMILVPRDGETGRAALSASQIESYLECPYKWFTLRRLGLSDNDATFSNMQTGSFVHRVLEVSRTELLRAWAQDEGLCGQEDDLDEALAHISYAPGSRITQDNLELAHELVEREFRAHLNHQKMSATSFRMQSLVPHSASEDLALERVDRQVHSVIDFELTRFNGFSPRYFELRFGRGDGAQRVSYAGVDFVGSIDRVDIDAHGQALVIDYKHKAPLGFASEYDVFKKEPAADKSTFVLPRRVQSLIYAQVVRRIMPDVHVVGALYLGTRGEVAEEHVISGALDVNVADLVMGEPLSAMREAHLCCGQPGTISFYDLLDECEAQIAAEIDELKAGAIPVEPSCKDACTYCPNLDCPRRLA